MKNRVRCVQGTDGVGLYGSDTIEEQLALYNLLDLNDEDFKNMRKVEDEVIEKSEKYFENKKSKFEMLLNGRTLREAILELENKNIQESSKSKVKLRLKSNLESEIVLKEKIKKLPDNKVPIVIAGGSFNSKGRDTVLTEEGKEILKNLIQRVNADKAYFVIGHKMQGYEKAIVDISKELNKKFEIDAIIPKMVSESERDDLLRKDLNGVCISTEAEELGIYKSFNYEIFERRSSVVVAFDGNSPVSNLVQEAKNGKGSSKIYINEDIPVLKEKARYLGGYVIPFNMSQNIVDKIINDNPEIV